ATIGCAAGPEVPKAGSRRKIKAQDIAPSATAKWTKPLPRLHNPVTSIYRLGVRCDRYSGSRCPRLNVHVSPNGFPALVLNADFRPLSYYPLSLWSWQDAIKAVFLE